MSILHVRSGTRSVSTSSEQMPASEPENTELLTAYLDTPRLVLSASLDTLRLVLSAYLHTPRLVLSRYSAFSVVRLSRYSASSVVRLSRYSASSVVRLSRYSGSSVVRLSRDSASRYSAVRCTSRVSHMHKLTMKIISARMENYNRGLVEI